MTDFAADTAAWTRNRSDELAVANGCRMNVARGQHVIDFAVKYLKLYEGDAAGEPMVFADWQIEATIRLFGWERWSERWGRWVRRFTRASIWVPKKNGKSPTLAAWGLYLLCADGEQGQKVFFGAKDGSQAREIAGKHAVEMVSSSPKLAYECEINKTTYSITHTASRSVLKPLSSGDSRSQRSKEGINGSILIDETHVVDRDFIKIISRAGLSRSEPLHIEVSTAGNDPQSYGKEQFDYGAQVESGAVTDERFFYLSYAAPQDLSDSDLAADPLKYGRMANPAMGRLVGEEDFLDDYTRSCVSIADLADFKMYRLNIWQKSANPWLRGGDWDRCLEYFGNDDLLGRVCYAGLDLAKTRDLTALAFVFPWYGGEYRLIVDYFMPEERAKELKGKIGFLQWAKDGFITLTPGSTCDYAFVRKRFRERCGQFTVKELAYDPWQAEETTQSMEQGVVVEGVEIETGTGVPRFLFKQTIQNFAGPTEEFEKAVIDGKMRHNGNPVLTWQAGNVTVMTDSNGNKRPVKPKRGDPRSIDGFVAGIMGFSRAMIVPVASEPEVGVW